MTKSDLEASGSSISEGVKKKRPEITVIISLPMIPTRIMQEQESSGFDLLTPFWLDKIAGLCFAHYHIEKEITSNIPDRVLFNDICKIESDLLLDEELGLPAQGWQVTHIQSCLWWMIHACFDIVLYFTEHVSDWEDYLVLGVGKNGNSLVFVRQGAGAEEYSTLRCQYVRECVRQELHGSRSVNQ